MRPDAEKLAVEWAKAQTAITDIVETRVATSLPTDFKLTFLRVVTIDGQSLAAETSDAGVALLQWDAYAYKGFQPSPDWSKASLLIRTLAERLVAEAGSAHASGYLLGFGQPTGPRRHIEQTNWARFSVDCFVAVRPA